jgi:sensor domain CHASE-containing protein
MKFFICKNNNIGNVLWRFEGSRAVGSCSPRRTVGQARTIVAAVCDLVHGGRTYAAFVPLELHRLDKLHSVIGGEWLKS